MSKHFFTLLFCCLCWNLQAQDDPAELNGAGYFKFTDELKASFHDVLNLKFRKSIPELNKAKGNNMFNLMTHYIEDYRDFLQAFVDGRRKMIYGKYLENKEMRLAWLEQGAEGDPYTLFTQADVHLRWGMIYALFQDNMEAFKSIKKAATLLERNTQKFPSFLPNKRAMGILHTMVGAIPGKYQWGASLAGLKGSIAQGLEELEAVIHHGKSHRAFEFNEEVQIVYGMLLLYMGNNDLKSWGGINTELLDFTQNPMAAYILASKGLRTGKSKHAMLILEKRARGDEFHPFPYLELMRGLCQLYRLDLNAEKHINNFLEDYRGDNGIKEAYQKLAWIALLKDDAAKYRYYMSLVEKKGEYNTSADRAAMNEMELAKDKITPNVALLKARLLFDGGYYDRSLSAMGSCNVKALKDEESKIEYYYRYGRIYQKMKKNDEALKNFDQTLAKGSKKPYYFACSAALQAGRIWESREEPEKAKPYYEKCLKEKPDQYQASLHSRAQNRLKVIKEAEKKKKKR